jgi:hypothetical protein
MAAQPPSGSSVPPPQASATSSEGDGKATAALVKDVLGGTQSLVRGELELARLELMEGLQAKGQAAGAAGAAGMLGLYVLGFLGLAGGAALALVLPTWAAWLIVAGVFLIILLGLLLFAKKRSASASLSPIRTKQRVKEDVAWARTLTRR